VKTMTSKETMTMTDQTTSQAGEEAALGLLLLELLDDLPLLFVRVRFFRKRPQALPEPGVSAVESIMSCLIRYFEGGRAKFTQR
jgi:hypothetical protein